jgi:four helix bundle protein
VTSHGPTRPEWARQLKDRTKAFALQILRLFRSLPKTEEARIIGKQLLHSSISVAANYRAVCRARSKAEFVSTMGLVIEEADETLFWLEILVEGNIAREAGSLMKEANELASIFIASRRTARVGASADSVNRQSVNRQ